ncbi:MAG: hypothetical protein KY453_02035 [Gemmatimonadetes bacterium]|nr:hypothetical protein [Gemmatimonadota bacterium]
MAVWEMAYRAAARGARVAAPLLGRGSSKLARGVRARAHAVDVLADWAADHREPSMPLLWIHAPSVGEGLQARAVLESVARLRPGLQTVFTHFSPSAEPLAGRMPVDVAGYLPWDLPGAMGRTLDALRPSVVAFTKTEVWPTLSREATARGVATALVAATLPAGSSRLRAPARWALAPSLRRLSVVAAIADDDAGRFGSLGVPAERAVVTGDPGIDSAAQRAAAADPDAPWLRPFRSAPRPTLVAGSTWPTDEAVLLPAATRLRETEPRLRLVVAPHEPTPRHLQPLERALADAGWAVARLGAVEEAGDAGGADAVVVDRVGVLAQLYTVGDVAWVGGGFHGQGLHSVLEPAAAGLPVLFGPRHHNARAAGELVEAGAARVVGDAPAAVDALRAWLGDGDARLHAGERALRYIGGHRGAAERTAGHLLGLLDRR